MTRILITIITLASYGCSGEGLKEFPTAQTSGKVLCNGQPVAKVQVVFAPVNPEGGSESGKSGLGVAADDGTFDVSTYSDKDGAVIGKHNVMVIPPHPEDFPDFTCGCETDGRKVVQIVDVVEGANNFTINLPAKANPKQSNISKEDLDDIKASNADSIAK